MWKRHGGSLRASSVILIFSHLQELASALYVRTMSDLVIGCPGKQTSSYFAQAPCRLKRQLFLLKDSLANIHPYEIDRPAYIAYSRRGAPERDQVKSAIDATLVENPSCFRRDVSRVRGCSLIYARESQRSNTHANRPHITHSCAHKIGAKYI